MPINGLTQHHTSGSGLARLGVLHKGAVRSDADKANNKPGKDLDYFRMQFAPEWQHLQPAWEALYGTQPKTITNAFLMTGNADAALDSWLEQWGASGLIHRCDGHTQRDWFNAEKGKVERNSSKPCEQPSCQCKKIGRINLFLPEFVAQTGALGYVALHTHSVLDIKHLYSLLSDLENLYGTLIRVPFVVSRRPQSVEIPEVKQGKPTGKRMKIVKSLIHIQSDPTFTQQQIAPRLMAVANALPANVNPATGEVIAVRPALPATTQSAGWSRIEAIAWVDAVTKQYPDLTNDNLKTMLGVRLFTEWQGTAEQATQAVNAWIEEAEAAAEEEPEIEY